MVSSSAAFLLSDLISSGDETKKLLKVKQNNKIKIECQHELHKCWNSFNQIVITCSMYPHNTQQLVPNLYSYPEGFAYLPEYLFLLMLPTHPLYFHYPLHFDDPDRMNLHTEKITDKKY